MCALGEGDRWELRLSVCSLQIRESGFLWCLRTGELCLLVGTGGLVRVLLKKNKQTS